VYRGWGGEVTPGPELLHVGRAAGGEGETAAQLTRSLPSPPLLLLLQLRGDVA